MDDPVKQGLSVLNGMAKMQMNVEQGAHLVYESVDDETLALLREETWFEFLVSKDPECARYKQWYAELRAQVLEWMTQDAAAEATAKP